MIHSLPSDAQNKKSRFLSFIFSFLLILPVGMFFQILPAKADVGDVLQAVHDQLLAEGIDNNLDSCVSTPTACDQLIFSRVGVGQIAFKNQDLLDLSADATQATLAALPNGGLTITDGVLHFAVTAGDAFGDLCDHSQACAQITLNNLSYVVRPDIKLNNQLARGYYSGVGVYDVDPASYDNGTLVFDILALGDFSLSEHRAPVITFSGGGQVTVGSVYNDRAHVIALDSLQRPIDYSLKRISVVDYLGQPASLDYTKLETYTVTYQADDFDPAWPNFSSTASHTLSVVKITAGQILQLVHDELVAEGINNNLDSCVLTPTACGQLIFSRAGVGQIAFKNHETLNLSDEATLATLLALPNNGLTITAGSLTFAATSSDAFGDLCDHSQACAQITFNNLSYVVRPDIKLNNQLARGYYSGVGVYDVDPASYDNGTLVFDILTLGDFSLSEHRAPSIAFADGGQTVELAVGQTYNDRADVIAVDSLQRPIDYSLKRISVVDHLGQPVNLDYSRAETYTLTYRAVDFDPAWPDSSSTASHIINVAGPVSTVNETITSAGGGGGGAAAMAGFVPTIVAPKIDVPTKILVDKLNKLPVAPVKAKVLAKIVKAQAPAVKPKVLGLKIYANNTLLRDKSDQKIYIVANGKIQHLLDRTFNARFKNKPVINVEHKIIAALPKTVNKR